MEHIDNGYILNEWAKKKFIEGFKQKNRHQRKSARAYSEIFSGDVQSSISSCATDTLRTLKNADANLRQKTQSAKNNIKKFKNNDFLIDYSSFNSIVRGLRKLLSLNYKGGSNYANYLTPNGIFSFRLANHNANGNNFTEGNINVSVFVAFHKYDVPKSTVPFKEFDISTEVFTKNPQAVVTSIVNAINKVLNGEEFFLPKEIAEPHKYPSEEKTQQENNNQNKIQENMNTNKKRTMRLNESQLRQIIKESVKKVLKENAIERRFGKYKLPSNDTDLVDFLLNNNYEDFLDLCLAMIYNGISKKEIIEKYPELEEGIESWWDWAIDEFRDCYRAQAEEYLYDNGLSYEND